MTRFLLLFVWLPIPILAQTLQFSIVHQDIIQKRLESYVVKNNRREPAVRQIFEDAGCTAEKLTEQPVKGLKAPNVICTLAGMTESEIVVGAHFDLVEEGHGVVDNWSGVSLLPSLYEGLKDVPRHHTFRFVGFGGEELGELGSKAYVKELLKSQEHVAAMVNLDTLGLAESEVWVNRADPNLVQLIKRTADAAKLPVSGVNFERIGSTDSESFRLKKIPAITIHSLTPATLRILHSPKDKIEAIHSDEYYRTYRLVLAYLAVLDQSLE